MAHEQSKTQNGDSTMVIFIVSIFAGQVLMSVRETIVSKRFVMRFPVFILYEIGTWEMVMPSFFIR